MNKTLKSIGFLFILVLTGIQMYAQSGGALWVGSRGGQRMAIMQIRIPAPMQGVENARTLTYTEEIVANNITRELTIKYNPDGKIVSISLLTPTPEQDLGIPGPELFDNYKGCQLPPPNNWACIVTQALQNLGN